MFFASSSIQDCLEKAAWDKMEDIFVLLNLAERLYKQPPDALTSATDK